MVSLHDEAALLKGLRLLVVDSDPDSRELLAFVFEQQGAEVASASSVAEAIKLIRQFKPTVLFSEIALPGEDGYRLLQKVQALPEQQFSPIIAIAATGYARTEDRLSALQAGFQAHFAKPLDLEQVVSFVSTLTTPEW